MKFAASLPVWTRPEDEMSTNDFPVTAHFVTGFRQFVTFLSWKYLTHPSPPQITLWT
jgi:hypothetical protein